jgi:hypothetical protein
MYEAVEMVLYSAGLNLWRVMCMKKYRVQEWLESVLLKIVRVLTAFSDACSIEKKPCTATTVKMNGPKFSIPAGYAVKRPR